MAFAQNTASSLGQWRYWFTWLLAFAHKRAEQNASNHSNIKIKGRGGKNGVNDSSVAATSWALFSEGTICIPLSYGCRTIPNTDKLAIPSSRGLVNLVRARSGSSLDKQTAGPRLCPR